MNFDHIGVGETPKYQMRARELIETRPWKSYRGRKRRCQLLAHQALRDGTPVVLETDASCGSIWTGRSEVHWGYFVLIEGPMGETWLGEDRRSICAALRKAASVARGMGWELLAVGLGDKWRESGLSGNTGYGSHPAHPDRQVHMLEPLPKQGF